MLFLKYKSVYNLRNLIYNLIKVSNRKMWETSNKSNLILC